MYFLWNSSLVLEQGYPLLVRTATWASSSSSFPTGVPSDQTRRHTQTAGSSSSSPQEQSTFSWPTQVSGKPCAPLTERRIHYSKYGDIRTTPRGLKRNKGEKGSKEYILKKEILYMCKSSWEMKLSTKVFKTWLLVAQDLWWDKEARKKIYVNQASVYCGKIISQLRGAPGRKDVPSQDCGSLSCKDSQDKNVEQAFFAPAVC